MTPTLLLDEMLTPAIAEQLRARGFDIRCVIEDPELRGMPDDRLLDHVISVGQVLVTLNIGDFATLHAALLARDVLPCGIVYVATTTFPQNRDFVGSLVEAITDMVRRGALPMAGETSFLSRPPPGS